MTTKHNSAAESRVRCGGDKDNGERWGGTIRLIIGVDDNSVGGYHEEGAGDQTWHNILMI